MAFGRRRSGQVDRHVAQDGDNTRKGGGVMEKLFHKKHTTNPMESIGDCAEFVAALTESGVLTGRKVSHDDWRMQLEKCAERKKNYRPVLTWFLSQYSIDKRLRAKVQSAKAFYQKFDELEWMWKQGSGKFLIPDKPLVKMILVEKLNAEITRAVGPLPIPAVELQYACYEYLTAVAELVDILSEKKNSLRMKSSSQVASRIIIPRLIEVLEDRYTEIYIRRLRQLMKWTGWNGQLGGSPNNISLTTGRVVFMSLLKQMMDETKEGAEWSSLSAITIQEAVSEMMEKKKNAD